MGKSAHEVIMKQIKVERLELSNRRKNGWEQCELRDYYTGVLNSLEGIATSFYESGYFTEHEYEKIDKALDELTNEF